MGRSSRRQQREDQELQLLTETTKIDSAGSEEEGDISAPATGPGRKNIFNSFNNIDSTTLDDEGGAEEEDDAEASEDDNLAGPSRATKKKKPKKKKKNKNMKTTAGLPDLPPTPLMNTSNSKNDKANGSTSNSKKKASTTGEVDEIDQALQELSKQLKSSKPLRDADQHPQQTVDNQQARINNLLKVDAKMLDPELELRRMFGARVVSSSGSTISPLHAMYGARVINDPHHQLNSKRKMNASLLAKPEPSWPPYSRASSGLSLRRLTEEEVAERRLAGDDSWFTFEHSVSFKLVQSRFLGAIMSLDPNQLVAILQRAPYHPDTLLQLSEVAAHNDDQGQALRFLNQALFVNEKTISASASSFFSSGSSRLDFRSIENRNIFRALDRKLLLLLKKGCYRSSFQTCKFLFSLNPYQDPFGSLLWLDFLAPKANQDQFFIDFLDHLAALQNRDPNGGIYTEAYPGLYYAKALCLRAIEDKDPDSNHDPSDFALESAILRFPQVIKPLAGAIGLSIPVQYERIERAQVEEGYTDDEARNMLHLKARIYATRSASLWKVAEASAWLRQILQRSVDKFAQPHDPDVQLGTQFVTNPQLHSVAAEGIYRAALVSEVQAFKNFLPPWAYSHSATAFSFDPLPPEGGTSYDGEYFKKSDGNEEDQAGGTNGEGRGGGEMEAEEVEEGVRGMGGEEQEMQEALEALLGNAGDEEDGRLQADQRLQLINQIQLVLQLHYDQVSPDQRQALLVRLDRLFDLPIQQPQHPQPQDINDDVSSDDDNEIRMPGAF